MLIVVEGKRILVVRGALSANERGAALILALLVTLILFALGSMAVAISLPESRVSSNFQRSVEAKYLAESAIEEIVGRQNDQLRSPRYLFDPASYQLLGPDSAVFTVRSLVAPLSTGDEVVGSLTARVLNTNPTRGPPPYTIQTTSTLLDGSSTTYQAVVDVVSLLDFAVYSEWNIYIGANITIGGRLYSGNVITLTGPNITLMQRVEYARLIRNTAWGDFRQGHSRVDPKPSMTDLADMTFFEQASKNAGVCTAGRGLYIGQDGFSAVGRQTADLFRNTGGRKPSNRSGCRDGPSCTVIDLTLFDFSASPIRYAGAPLIGFDGTPLTDFNGVLFVDGELHVWGHLGGRSVEDATVTDTRNYMTPPTVPVNLYSNNRLDRFEDGANGGSVDGKLAPAGRGVNLGIYSSGNIYIDHNIFAGENESGLPVRMALVARNNVRIDSYSPRAIFIEAAVLAVNGTWSPYGRSPSTHQFNYWANNRGDLPPATRKYDLDGDGVLEGNTFVGRPGDRNENNVLRAWTLRNDGNLVTRTSPNSGVWSAYGHPRYYNYDTELRTSEVPCYPTMPDYGIVSGSFTEVLVGP
ncbi:MAG: PilX N-terminal domain-containing pilus assembly protein [Gemmatimonadota bacterium]